MNILLVNSHHYYVGGAEKYYFDLAKILESHGHNVAYFSTQNKNNIKTKWSKYFTREINFDNKSLLNYLKIIYKQIFPLEDIKNINKILDNFKADIVHINNIYYYLSPYILRQIRKRGIPVVQTVHDYQLVSPNVNLYARDRINEETKRHKYYKVLLNKSIKNSLVGSLFACLYSYREYLFKIHTSNVNTFITPSLFMKKKLIGYGLNKSKILHMPNFILDLKQNNINKLNKKYVLYFGRISNHKGIIDILRVSKILPKVNFVIAGSASDINILKTITSIKQKNIEILIQPKSKTLIRLINNCCFSICPSKWYENQPYVILESYLAGKPVVASDIGGISEIVLDGKTGCLFSPGNLREMAKKINKLWRNPDLTDKMGKYAQSYVRKKYNAENYYDNIIKIYTKLVTS